MLVRIEPTILVLLVLAFSACGVKIKSDPIKVEPVKIEHRIILDTDSLYKSYQDICKDEVADPTNQAEINSCADEKLNSFIEKFTTV